MTDDAALLHRYVEQGSEVAFAELVQRHIPLVYAAALRRVDGDAHQAAEVTQHVFTAVARDARKLARHPVFSAWLHAATRNAAVNLMISDRRRRAREAEAVSRSALEAAEAAPQWEQVRPLLDAAIDELAEADRAAVVLRFLERRAFADIGARLRLSEDAARVRTDRALDKLRAALVRRGITSSSAALAALVTAQPVVAAPAGLAASIAAQSLAAGAATPAFLTLFSTMTAKSLVFGAIAAVAVFFAGRYVGSLSHSPDGAPSVAAETSRTAPQLAALRQENDRLQLDVAALRTDVARLTEANAKLEARAAASAPSAAPPPTLAIGMSRGEVQQAVLNNLRQIAAARDQFRFENNGRSPGRVQELIGKTAYIKRVTTVDGEDYANLSMTGEVLTVTTPGGISVTYDTAGGAATTQPEFTPEELQQRAAAERTHQIEYSAQKAAQAYQAAHNGDRPPNDRAILPYFATPKEGADFVEFLETHRGGKR